MYNNSDEKISCKKKYILRKGIVVLFDKYDIVMIIILEMRKFILQIRWSNSIIRTDIIEIVLFWSPFYYLKCTDHAVKNFLNCFDERKKTYNS